MAEGRRLLILGAGGFVGRHLCETVRSRPGFADAVMATGRVPGEADEVLDLTDVDAVTTAIRAFRPTHVVNLAGIAAPMAARKDPDAAWALHATAPEALGRIILRETPECWLLHVGSGMVYGRTALSGRPLTEADALEPMDPYGVTKAAGDLAMGALANDGLKSIRLRPFNHTGPRQTDDFAIPAFASQIARIEAGLSEAVIRVGNLEAIRDFLDVQDVVDAYCAVLDTADDLTPGTAFNVASGTGLKIGDGLAMLLAESDREIAVEADPARQRPSDIPVIIGDASALSAATGWRPRVDPRSMIQRVLAHFRIVVTGR